MTQYICHMLSVTGQTAEHDKIDKSQADNVPIAPKYYTNYNIKELFSHEPRMRQIGRYWETKVPL